MTAQGDAGLIRRFMATEEARSWPPVDFGPLREAAHASRVAVVQEGVRARPKGQIVTTRNLKATPTHQIGVRAYVSGGHGGGCLCRWRRWHLNLLNFLG